MNISLGIFDLFTYAVPGSLYLGLIVYVSVRAGWVHESSLQNGNTTLLVIGGLLASYLLGHISYVLGRAAGRLARSRHREMAAARDEFLARVPAAADRPFVAADRSILQAAVEVRNSEAAVEITRLRALSLMLRNSSPAFGLGAVVAVVQLFTGPVLPAACGAVLLAFGAVVSLSQSGKWTVWANLKTLEVAFWIEDIDDFFGTPATRRPEAR